MRTLTVDLLRHGACEGGEIFRGSTDVALSDEGWRQMRASVANVGGWNRIVTSSLQRCRLFAEALAGQHQLALQVENGLREIHFGEWEGQQVEQVRERYATVWRQFVKDPANAAIPGAECIPDFHQRVIPCVESLLDGDDEHLLLVTHGGVIRAVMCHWLQMPLQAISRLSVPYACMTRFRIYQREGSAPWVQLCAHGAAEFGGPFSVGAQPPGR